MESSSLRCGLVCRSDPVQFTFAGRLVTAYPGETVAAALTAAGQRALRHTLRGDQPRGLFCGMGVCFECLVQVDGCPNMRACQVAVANGMKVEPQAGHESWESPP